MADELVGAIGALVGGLGLFLLGMGMMTDGLKLAAGPALHPKPFPPPSSMGRL